MARIIPFRGILYNQTRIDDIKNVVAPPYDVISDKKQRELHERHENNVVKLILGLDREGDEKGNNRHTRAAAWFQEWIAGDILSEDTEQALYLTAVDFLSYGQTVTRYGLITRVGLEPFENGVILPHEQTFSSVKSERLELMKICKANFSQIFSIYPDKHGILEILVNAVKDMDPIADLVDDVNERHRLWRLTEPAILETVQAKMADQKLFIADGHHRYETALNYRDFLKENLPGFSDKHPANNIMMYLCSMEDPGLVIYPTHRMLHSADEKALEGFLGAAADYFDISEIGWEGSYEEALDAFRKELADNSENIKIGTALHGKKTLFVFTLKPGVADKKMGDVPESLRNLDVTVLTNLIFIELLGLTSEALDDKKLISYHEEDTDAIDAAVKGDCRISFILNATKIEQVREIAESGETMPRKTTYFYPKALTGLVFNKLTE